MEVNLSRYRVVIFSCLILFFILTPSLVFTSNDSQKIDPPLATAFLSLDDNDVVILSELLDPNMEWKLRVLIKREVVGTEIVERPLPRSSSDEPIKTEKTLINITGPVVSQSEVKTTLENRGIPYEKIDYYLPPSGSVVSEVTISDGTITKRQLYELAGVSWVFYINAIPAEPIYDSKSNYFSIIKRFWIPIIGVLIGALMISVVYYALKRKKDTEGL